MFYYLCGLLLLLVGVVWASSTDGDLDLIAQMLRLSNRMDDLGHVISVQNKKLSEQDKQLNQQSEKLTLQTRELRKQAEKLLHHEALLQAYKKMTQLQQIELEEQATLLLKQNSELHNLKALLFHKEEELTDESHNVKQAKIKPTSLNDIIPLVQSVAPSKVYMKPKVDTDMNDPHQGSVRSKDMSDTHNVNARSDDGGPLEVVVSQLSQKVIQLEADIATLKNSEAQQDTNIQDAQTSTFVHWGNSQCGSSALLVYSGTVGGSYYEHSGAATNYLCLTFSPVVSSHPVPPAVGYLYGSEYETYDGTAHFQRDPVCAVCRSAFSTTVMIPGTNMCAPGWHLQYNGYLMAGYFGHQAGSEYICVDSSLESSLHSEADQNGKLMYFITTHCGSLPCPPYTNNTIVLCAVCSK